MGKLPNNEIGFKVMTVKIVKFFSELLRTKSLCFSNETTDSQIIK